MTPRDAGTCAAAALLAWTAFVAGVGAFQRSAGAAVAGAASSPLGERARCAAYGGLPAGWNKDPHAGMVHIDGGHFGFGSDRGYAEERPVVDTRITAFWIDRTEVTNAQFASFVAATGYVTDAERHPGVAVFIAPGSGHGMPALGSWWHLVDGADWRHPEGPGSSIAGREHDPVVDVSWADANAYAHWLGHLLPGEAQWEYAARGGLDNEASDRGLTDAQGHPQANVWQGLFPIYNRADDGFEGRAPVGCFAPNRFGLQDMIGNVWEWTADRYTDQHDATRVDGDMPAVTGAANPDRRVIKGGSFLCSTNYCARARASSRQGQEADLPTSHVGFRTIALS